jgi:flavin reductase (DIM6/NTAB) family NADH-FMN oxidoreductase RutF
LERKVGDKAQRYFVTGVSMITSIGSLGRNVMAAEWTMQVSYDPLLVAVFIHYGASTLKNIRETKEFGVNVASDKQTSLVNIAGGYSRTEIDKLRVRNTFRFLKSKHIKSPIIADCVVNAECKLVAMKKLGDHVMVIGKVVTMIHDETKKPLVYHTGKYYQIGSIIDPIRQEVKVDKSTFEWFSNESEGKFILKCAGTATKSGRRFLVLNQTKNNMSYETIPYVIPKRGANYLQTLQKYLTNKGLKVRLKQDPVMKRLVLNYKNKIQRVNFVLFKGTGHNTLPDNLLKNKTEQLLKALDD